MSKESQPRQTKMGCVNPAIGDLVSQTLSQSIPEDLRAHLAKCPACRLERLVFDSLDQYRVRPSQRLVERIRRTIRQISVPSGRN